MKIDKKSLLIALIISTFLVGIPLLFNLLESLYVYEKISDKSILFWDLVVSYLIIIVIFCIVTAFFYILVREYRKTRNLWGALHKMLYIRARVRIAILLYCGLLALFFGLIYMVSGYYFSSPSWILSVFLSAIISFPIVYLFYKKTKNKKKWIEEERKKLDEERRKLIEE